MTQLSITGTFANGRTECQISELLETHEYTPFAIWLGGRVLLHTKETCTPLALASYMIMITP